MEYRGLLRIDTDGTYTFATNSDDGSALWISPSVDNPLYADADVQNGGTHGIGTQAASGQFNLTAGDYDFIVRLFEVGGGNGLDVLWDPTGGTNYTAIPGSNYYHLNTGPLTIDMPDTAVTVTSDSTLALPASPGNKLGELTLINSQLTISGATDVTFSGFTGTGTVVGAVTVPAGSKVSPGTDTTIGTLNTGGLTLESGSLLTWNIDTGSNLDQINVTDTDGLTILGGGITLLDGTGSGTFGDQGTYNLISYLGTLTGDVNDLSVENKALGRNYIFGTNAGFVTLTIGVSGYWDGGAGTANWSDTLNWNGIAPVTGDTLLFASAGAGGAVLNNDLAGESYANLRFYAGAPAFTLQGNGVTLTGEGIDNTIIENDSTSTQTVDLAIALGVDGTINAAAGDVVVSGDISGAYGLTKAGSGQLTLSGTMSYTGGTTISAGSLLIDATTLGAAGSDVTLAGGSLDLGGTSQTVGAVSVTAAAASGDTISNGDLTGTSYDISNASGDAVISANLLGTAGLTKSGEGTATLSGNNTYTGDTVISAGTLKVGSATAIPHGAGKGSVTVDGTLDLNGISPTLNGLSGTGFVTSSVAGAATLTVGDGDSDSDFNGSVEDGSGTVALAKIGSGTLLLEKANTYSGGTTVTTGTLSYNSTDAFGTGTITFADGTTFTAKGGGSAEGRYRFNNEDIANDVVLTGGKLNIPLSFGGAKDIWLKGDVSGAGGFNITGTHRDLSLSGNNSFQGGVSLISSASGGTAGVAW